MISTRVLYCGLVRNMNAGRRVHFNEDKLVEIILIPGDTESVSVRKCYWEVFARDRARFKDRINLLEHKLSTILEPEHRERIYKNRFLHEK